MFLFLWVVSIVVCLAIADYKNKDKGKAFVGGLLFGVFAVVYYLLADSNEE